MSFRTLYTAVMVAVLASSVAGAAALSIGVSACQEAHLAGLPLTSADALACEKVLAQVGAGQQFKRGLVSVGAAAKVDVNVNPFVNFMSSCDSLTTGLSASLNTALSAVGDLGLDLSATLMLSGNAQANLLERQVTEALASLSLKVATSVGSLVNIAACTDARVAASTYEAFRTFVGIHQQLLTMVSVNASLWAKLNCQAALYAHLTKLQVDLNAYVGHLFNYISVDLDSTLNLRAMLSASVQTAIKACV